jgi:hypothetical protein
LGQTVIGLMEFLLELKERRIETSGIKLHEVSIAEPTV